MIKIKDVGIILSSQLFQEKFIIVKCLTKNHGIVSGLSRISKKKHDIIAGNVVDVCWKARLSEQLGYVDLYVQDHVLSKIMFVRHKLLILNCALQMLLCSLKEKELNTLMYQETIDLIESLKNKDDLLHNFKMYVNFEARLLNSCGYSLNWSECAVTKSKKDIYYISPKTGNAVTREVGEKYSDKLFKIPLFFINEEMDASKDEILNGLKIFQHFIEQHIFFPQHIKIPDIRDILIKELSVK
ncbi:MAG: DNA repair protein RecO (recombination protein O) [Candidatus Midichloriaceae bacterium]